jgi:hypothetical protein
MALSFSGVYPDRTSEVGADENTQTLPAIDEDDFM